MHTRHIFLVVSTVLVTACGGGGDSGSNNGGNNTPPPAPTNAGGVWEGSTFGDQSGQTYETTGVVTENNGEARFVNEQGQQFILTGISGTNGAVSATITAIAPVGYTFLDGSTVTSGTLSGTVVGRDSLEGDWNLNTGESGTVTLNYNPIYERDSSLALVQGTWVSAFGEVFTVDGNGGVYAQDSYACVYDGNIDIINAAYNAYQVVLEVSNCPGSEGTYSGLGVLVDNMGTNDAFVVQLDNGQWVFLDVLQKS